MNKVFIFIFCISLSLSSIAQTDLEKLTELQQALDEIQVGIGEGENVDYRKITAAIKEIDSVKRERDSLATLVELLQLELLLAKNKMVDVEKRSVYTKANGKEAESYLKTAMQSSKNGSEEHILRGCYVVISSAREEGKAKELYQTYVKKYPQYSFMLVHNKLKTWNHICLDEAYPKDIIGQKVHQVRQIKELKDTWWMLLD